MRQLDLTLLHTFKTIVECKSISLASQRLHKTQAAISIQLKKLEETVGERLIERAHFTTEMTDNGELLYHYAQRMLALSDEALAIFSKQELSGTVRFGIPDDYASAYLAPVLKRFVQKFPNVKVKIVNDISHNICRFIENDTLDIALVTRVNGTGAGETLSYEQLHWVCASDYIHNDNMPVPLALYPNGCLYRHQILTALSNSNKNFEVIFECSSVAGVQVAIDSGLAIAATLTPLINNNWRILEPSELGVSNPGHVILELRTRRGELSPAVLQFAQEIKEMFD